MFFLVAFGRIGRHPVEHGVRVDGIDAVRIDRGGNVADVLAPVSRGRERDGRAFHLQPAQPDAHAENVHLPARVVDVVLAVHRVANGFEQVADRRAVRRVPAVPDVQRTGGVR